MTTKNLIKIHLYLASFFLPFLIIMPLSGTFYLLGLKGTIKQTIVAEVQEILPENKSHHKVFFQELFKKNNLISNFDKIKYKPGNKLIFRPSHRTHLEAKINDQKITIIENNPDLIKKLIELHKGHGPHFFKRLQTLFGFGFLIIVFSGFFLALTNKVYRRQILVPFALGFFILGLSFFI